MYIAEKFKTFLPPENAARRVPVMVAGKWAAPRIWAVASATFTPTRPQDRINMRSTISLYKSETPANVLDKRLAENEYLAGYDYTIADMAVFPWNGGLVTGWSYE